MRRGFLSITARITLVLSSGRRIPAEFLKDSSSILHRYLARVGRFFVSLNCGWRFAPRFGRLSSFTLILFSLAFLLIFFWFSFDFLLIFDFPSGHLNYQSAEMIEYSWLILWCFLRFRSCFTNTLASVETEQNSITKKKKKMWGFAT